MPKPREDLTGKEINDLVFLSYSHVKNRRRYWNIKCFCGNVFSGIPYTIKSGNTKSCGCLKTKHNLSTTPEYVAWDNMKKRCYRTSNRQYKDYGGRGITICDSWLNDFTAFYKDMGPRPSPKHSIERKDNNGNYCLENCKWATKKEQTRNQRSNRLLTYNNETKTMAEWAEILNIPYDTLNHRIHRGWSDEKALNTPVKTSLA